MGWFWLVIASSGESQQSKSELDQYLEESLFPRSHEFDVMRWWKLNEPKYPTLSKMAHDILTLPVSTVDPESVFVTGVKEMDRYRCAFKPETVEALYCAKDWLQTESIESLSLISRPLHAMKSQSQIQSSTAVKFGGVTEVLVVSGWSSKSTFLIEDFGNFFCMSSISVRSLSAGISILVSTTGNLEVRGVVICVLNKCAKIVCSKSSDSLVFGLGASIGSGGGRVRAGLGKTLSRIKSGILELVIVVCAWSLKHVIGVVAESSLTIALKLDLKEIAPKKRTTGALPATTTTTTSVTNAQLKALIDKGAADALAVC
ncbi:zinc finger BED domain-containing protein DAYSLEEPER-like protein [Tanacetum coccineum]